MNVITINNIDHLQVQQETCELKMTKFGWNVAKLDNSCNVRGGGAREGKISSCVYYIFLQPLNQILLVSLF
jgi:hypothetical protein